MIEWAGSDGRDLVDDGQSEILESLETTVEHGRPRYIAHGDDQVVAAGDCQAKTGLSLTSGDLLRTDEIRWRKRHTWRMGVKELVMSLD